MSNPFLAEIRMVGFNFAPRGWAFCNGQSLSISQNTALFSLLGTTYGGNGQTTFNLPDCRGRVPMHFGSGAGLSNYSLGQAGGAETNTLSINQLPAHNHVVMADGDANDTVASNPSGHWLSGTGFNTAGANHIYSRTDPLLQPVQMHPQMIGITGLGQPFTNKQPFLVLNFIIALQGIFPSQT